MVLWVFFVLLVIWLFFIFVIEDISFRFVFGTFFSSRFLEGLSWREVGFGYGELEWFFLFLFVFYDGGFCFGMVVLKLGRLRL